MTTPDREEPRGPVRSCVGCRTRRTSGQLVRITRAAGHIVVGGVSNGRGAWLCRSVGADGLDGSVVEASCLDDALRKRAFNKAWRTTIGSDEEREIREVCGGGGR